MRFVMLAANLRRPSFDHAILAAAFLTSLVAVSPNLADPDLWGHVQYGRDALREGLDRTNTYSYTAEGFRWINHENLAELLLAVGADTVGPIGLMIGKTLLGAGVLALVMGTAIRRRLSLITVCLVTMLVAINLTYFWALRPQLLSFVWYTCLLGLLQYCFHGWAGRCVLPRFDARSCEEETSSRAAAADDCAAVLGYSRRRMKWLWLAPVFICLWTNSHGAFVAGLCIYAAYLGLRGFEAWMVCGRRSLGLLKRFALMLAVACLATFLNPYGPGLHRWMWGALSIPRPEILEWDPPNLFTQQMIPLWLITFTWIAALALTKRSRDFTQCLVLALVYWQLLKHVRHVPFFAIPCGLWMAPHLDSVLRRFRLVRDETAFASSMKPAMRWALSLVLLAAFGLLAVKLGDRCRQIQVSRQDYPVSAFQFMADHQLSGNVLVTFNWAQYALAAFGAKDADDAGLRVHFDGRFRTCYPQQVIDEHFDLVLADLWRRYRSPLSPPPDDAAALERGRPALAVLCRTQAHSVNVMFRHQRDWALLYQDGLAQIWGRREIFDNPTDERYLPPNQRRITDAPQTGAAPWPAFPAAGCAPG